MNQRSSRAEIESVPGIGERFEIRRHLGAGGFGTVYEAFDKEARQLVALKVLRSTQAQALYRFKQEFRSLADLRHPNLVALHELLCFGDRWMFTMDLVDGLSFLRYVRPDSVPPRATQDPTVPSDSSPSPRDVDPSVSSPSSGESGERPVDGGVGHELRLRSALLQLVDGVRALHAAGKIHRDIKPSNVLVRLDGHVTILDFGLIRELEPSDPNVSIESTVIGTPAYASPEQLAGFSLSEASDWYSVGVMLFEALTGRRPHVGSVVEIMRAKQMVEPDPPRRLDPSAPLDLSELAVRLLQRISEERPGGTEIRKRLLAARASIPPSPVVARPKRILVGRDPQLGAVLDAYEQMLASRQPVALHVRGASGLGKSALLSRAVDELEARPDAPLVLVGRCYEQESVPYKGLDNVIDALSRYLCHREREETAALMPLDAAVLGKVFPVLQRVRAVADAPRIAEAGDSQELRRRAFAALRELFSRIAFRRPLVLAIDDLQWGDVDSASFLRELLAPPLAPPMLVLASYRDEDLDGNAALVALRKTEPGHPLPLDVEVGPLGSEESIALARALIQRVDDQAELDARHIAREADGSPFFLTAMVEWLQHGGDASSIRLESVLLERFERLDDSARRILETVAAAGVPRPIAIVRAASGVGQGAHDAIGALRASTLVRTGGMRARDAIEIFHDRIRQAVLATMSPARVVEVHSALASALEDTGQADPESLLAHFRAAGDRPQAWRYAVIAADRASDALAFARAADLYRLALELFPDRDALELSSKRADALANQGKAPEAASAYRAAAALAPPAQSSRMLQKAAGELLKFGHVDDGVALMAHVAREAGFYYPRAPWMALLSAALSRARLFFRGMRFKLRDADAIAPVDLRRVDLCWALGSGFSNVDPVRSLDFQTRGLLLALRLGEPERLARAFTLEAGLVAIRGERARRTVERTIALARSIAQRNQTAYIRGLVRVVEGITAYLAGRWKQAFEASEEAVSLLTGCPGAAFELTAARLYALWSLFYLGRVKEMSARVRLHLRAALDDGDLLSATDISTANPNLAWLLDDDTTEARARAEAAMRTWSRSGFHVQHFFYWYALVQADLYEGKVDDAWRRFHDRWPDFSRSTLRLAQHLRVEAVQLRARCTLALARTKLGVERDDLLAKVSRDARRLVRERAPYSPGYDAMLRASVAYLRGDRVAACALLRDAMGAFTAADMSFHACIARYRLGALLGDDEGRQLLQEAQAFMGEQQIRDPSRTAALLAPGFEP